MILCERISNGAEAPGESSIEAGKNKETLELFEGLGSGPLSYVCHFGLVHSYTLRTDDITQE